MYIYNFFFILYIFKCVFVYSKRKSPLYLTTHLKLNTYIRLVCSTRTMPKKKQLHRDEVKIRHKKLSTLKETAWNSTRCAQCSQLE